tara:strand:+ start:640 stop:1530 length:891 start_codon:yes stop_codon:yes gene_type:complete
MFVSAGSEKTIKFIDVESGKLIKDVMVKIEIYDEEGKIRLNKLLFVGDGKLELGVGSDTANGEIIIDERATKSVDYYFSGEMVFEGNVAEVGFLKVSKISGNVHDDLGNLIKEGELDFECDKLSSINFPKKTDKYGSFSTYVPTGECVVSVNYKNFVGRKIVNSEKGDSLVVELVLEERSAGENIWLWILSVVLIFFVIRNLKNIKRNFGKTRKKDGKNKKVKNIIKTLNDKEKEIVEFVIGNNNEANSSKIRHELKIPKTSLSRILVNLEKKKIVCIERHGKMKKVKLAEWLVKK